jgi:hypothetical protein
MRFDLASFPLIVKYLQSPRDIWRLLALGDENKKKASTAMNARSSRSHSWLLAHFTLMSSRVFIMTVTQRSPEGSTKVGKLNLVDLAGSEKVGKTGATGSVLEEAKNINKSLSALGNCIYALTSSKKVHVPYRDSKLTRILQVRSFESVLTLHRSPLAETRRQLWWCAVHRMSSTWKRPSRRCALLSGTSILRDFAS